MNNELVRKFYFKFLFYIFILSFVLIALVILSVICWIQYVKHEEIIFYAIGFTVFAVIALSITIKELFPFFKDLRYVRKKDWCVAEGVVISFKEVHTSADPPTTYFYPNIKVDDSDKLLTLDVDGAQQGEKYEFIYLPYTKLAIIVNEEK